MLICLCRTNFPSPFFLAIWSKNGVVIRAENWTPEDLASLLHAALSKVSPLISLTLNELSLKKRTLNFITPTSKVVKRLHVLTYTNTFDKL